MQDDQSYKQGKNAPRERAIALRYQRPDELPTVTASGAGYIARQIIALAAKHNVPIEENVELADLLSQLDIGERIQPESFKLVAEVMSFLYHTDKEWREGHDFLDHVIGEEDTGERPLLENPA